MNNLGQQTQVIQQPAQTQQLPNQTQVVTQNQAQQSVQVQAPINNIQQPPVTQAVFTQEQLNSIIGQRLAAEKSKYDTLSQQYAQLTQQSQSYLTELAGYKNKEIAVNAGVPTQFIDYAIYEASKLAVNNKSFEDAMKEFVASNGALFGVSQQTTQAIQQLTQPASNATQVPVTPAQSASVQQTVTAPNQQVVSITPVQQSPAQTNNGVVPNLQFGSTNIQGATAPQFTNTIDGQVDAFLKKKGLRK